MLMHLLQQPGIQPLLLQPLLVGGGDGDCVITFELFIRV